ncbi:MAG: hypothetical protein WBK20_03365 [Spirochaetota bacterium]
MNLVLSGAKVEDIKGFITQWYNEGAIKADGTTYQDVIAKAYGYDIKRVTDYNEFAKLMSNGKNIQYGVIRFYSTEYKYDHNINLYSNNGGWYVSDVGKSTNHGMSWDKILGIDAKNKFRYYQYLIKI